MADDEDFEYVVERRTQDKICFLSGRSRYPPVKLPPKKVPLDLSITTAFYKIKNKVRSNKGVGGLANLSPRFAKVRTAQVPDPAAYDISYKTKVKPSYVPFGQIGKVIKFPSKTPGPGSYPPGCKCRTIPMMRSFGGPVHMKPAVEVLCIAKPSDTCAVCKNLCVGDYWQYLYSTFICLNCMLLERKKPTKFTRAELQEFKKMRNCSFMHKHEGTVAGVQILKNNQIMNKFKIENYLELFCDKYR